MSRDRALELASESFDANCLQRARIELVRQPALVPECERIAVVKHQVGVGGVLEPAVRAGAMRDRRIGTIHQAGPYRALAFILGGETVGANPSIAVGGLAAVKFDRVNHAVAVEPVIAA